MNFHYISYRNTERLIDMRNSDGRQIFDIVMSIRFHYFDALFLGLRNILQSYQEALVQVKYRMETGIY